MSVLSEDEYLEVVERTQRAMMGDGTAMKRLLMEDVPRLLADWRELQRMAAEQSPR